MDDLGQNLKAASAMGMQTLRVPSHGGDEAVAAAIAQLEQLLGGKSLRQWVPGTVTPVARMALAHAPLRTYLAKLLQMPAGALLRSCPLFAAARPSCLLPLASNARVCVCVCVQSPTWWCARSSTASPTLPTTSSSAGASSSCARSR